MSLYACGPISELPPNIGNHGRVEDIALCVSLRDVWGTASRLRVFVAADLRNAETSIECILPLEIQTRLLVLYQNRTLTTTRCMIMSRLDLVLSLKL